MKKFIKRIQAPTPKKWKVIATAFGSFATTFTTAFGAVKALSIDTPNWFNISIGVIIFICTSITTYAIQHEIPCIQEISKEDDNGQVQ